MNRAPWRHDAGQVLAFFAMILPIVLLPVAAYTVDASVVSGRAAALHAATAVAAETASEQLSVSAKRAGGALALDGGLAKTVATETIANEEPGASTDSISVNGSEVTVSTTEIVTVPFNLFGGPITLHARASARLVAGYDSPSSLLPLPISTF
jgi:Flp pilus assembly protein TadG